MFGPVMPGRADQDVDASQLPRRRSPRRDRRRRHRRRRRRSVTRTVRERSASPSRARRHRGPTARQSLRSRRRRCATAKPMPEAPPVMTAVRPRKSSAFIVGRSRSARHLMMSTRLMKSSSTPITATTDDDGRQRVLGLALEHREFVGELGDLIVARQRLDERTVLLTPPTLLRLGDRDREDHREVRHRQRSVPPVVPDLDPLARANRVPMPRVSFAEMRSPRARRISTAAFRKSRPSAGASNFAADSEMLIWKLAGVRSSPPRQRRRRPSRPTALPSLRPRSSLRSRMRSDPVVASAARRSRSATVALRDDDLHHDDALATLLDDEPRLERF
mgnify:CR=1 FL=1